MAPKKADMEYSLYVAETLGRISADVESIKGDIKQLNDAIIPMRKKIYFQAGVISAIGLFISVIVNFLIKAN